MMPAYSLNRLAIPVPKKEEALLDQMDSLWILTEI